MGVYVIEPQALVHIPDHEYFDIPDLVQSLLAAGDPVGAFTFDGLWFDIGRKDDYELAAEAWEHNENGKSPVRNEEAALV